MMKIAFLNGIFARIGGIEEFTKDLALELLQQNVEVDIVCASLKNHTLDRLKQAGATIRKVPVYHGCRWNIPDYALLPFACFWLRGASVVFHQKLFAKWIYRFLPRGATHIYLTSYSPAEQFEDAASAKNFFSFFDGVITQLDSFKDELLGLGVECPIYVIPLIPPHVTDLPVNENVDQVLRIGMMGRLEPQKNPVYACDVVDALSRSLPDGKDSVEFNIYGNGSLLSSLRDKVALSKFRAVFHGRYQRSDAERIVSENDFFLITSKSEGQCIVALEILASGRPVFATAIGALPSILNVPDRGALLPDKNANQAGKVIKSWFEHNNRISAEQIQESYLIDFNRDAIIAQYLELLFSLGQNE